GILFSEPEEKRIFFPPEDKHSTQRHTGDTLQLDIFFTRRETGAMVQAADGPGECDQDLARGWAEL
ncbi:MAG: hypothetical protein K2K81_05865, partial [Muribaculaceae bacterium]|nr:hypothetical protein [Muribaculaceae bacterium]